MADSKFYQTGEKLTLDQIAKLCDLKLPKNIDKKRIFIDINTKYNLITTEQRYLRLILLEYNIEDITFYRNNNSN